MMPVDAALVRKANDWRLVTAEDFGPNAAAWMRDNGQDLTGRIPGDYSGRNNQRDVAYLLAPAGPPAEAAQPAAPRPRRVLLLVEGVNLYDAEYPEIVGAARVPKEVIANIEWGKNPPQGTPDGDGLLIVRRSGDFASGLVLFVSDKHIVTGVPVNYQQVRLR
jgi:hypothetical protein